MALAAQAIIVAVFAAAMGAMFMTLQAIDGRLTALDGRLNDVHELALTAAAKTDALATKVDAMSSEVHGLATSHFTIESAAKTQACADGATVLLYAVKSDAPHETLKVEDIISHATGFMMVERIGNHDRVVIVTIAGITRRPNSKTVMVQPEGTFTPCALLYRWPALGVHQLGYYDVVFLDCASPTATLDRALRRAQPPLRAYMPVLVAGHESELSRDPTSPEWHYWVFSGSATRLKSRRWSAFTRIANLPDHPRLTGALEDVALPKGGGEPVLLPNCSVVGVRLGPARSDFASIPAHTDADVVIVADAPRRAPVADVASTPDLPAQTDTGIVIVVGAPRRAAEADVASKPDLPAQPDTGFVIKLTSGAPRRAPVADVASTPDLPAHTDTDVITMVSAPRRAPVADGD